MELQTAPVGNRIYKFLPTLHSSSFNLRVQYIPNDVCHEHYRYPFKSIQFLHVREI